MKQSIRAIGFAIVVNAAFAGHAWAHAHIKRTIPDEQASVTSPSELDLTFSESLNLAFSGVKLTGPDQHEVKLQAGALSEDGKTLKAAITDMLAPGVYTVDWHVLSVDGHKTNGSYRFVVKP